MSGGFRREHAFDASLSETLRVLGETRGEIVAHERSRDRSPGVMYEFKQVSIAPAFDLRKAIASR
jgi:hypothetical protein